MWHPTARIALILFAVAGSPVAGQATEDEMHEKLAFLVGAWETAHNLPTGEGETTMVRGEAVIEW